MPESLPDAANFRAVLGRLPTGVVIVTGGDREHPSGLVVGSFMSQSLDPPLVAVSPARTSSSWPAPSPARGATSSPVSPGARRR